MKAFLAAAALLALPAAAAAQGGPAPVSAIDEIAADLAYGYCPLFLAGQFPLAGNERLGRFGFGAVTRQPHPRVGEMSLVTARRPDGEIAFGGASGRACAVVVSGPKRAETLARWRSSMSFMGLPFETVANPGPAVAGVTLQTFAAPVERQRLYVQLAETALPTPTVSAQLFVMDR